MRQMNEKELLDELKKWVNHDDRALALIKQYGREKYKAGQDDIWEQFSNEY
jgi:hypothetical protein